MITSSKKAAFAYTRRVIALPVMILLVALFSIHLKAQTDAKTSEAFARSSNVIFADTLRKVDHIEVYGETGKADTATVYFKNGRNEVYILHTTSEHAAFNKKYSQYLSHPPIQIKEPPKPKPAINESSFQYQPLNPVPEIISNITFSPETIWLTLKDGTKEQYQLNNKEDRKLFESKYGSLKFKKNT